MSAVVARIRLKNAQLALSPSLSLFITSLVARLLISRRDIAAPRKCASTRAALFADQERRPFDELEEARPRRSGAEPG
jgi:hypothetical protein